MLATALTFVCLNCTEPEFYRVQHIRPLLNEVLPSQCFADNMRTQGVSEHWIEALATAQDKIPVKFFYRNDTTVGETYPNQDNIIRLNSKFHDSFSYCRTASNVAHEILHLKGFRHFADAAYAVNQAFEACCSSF